MFLGHREGLLEGSGGVVSDDMHGHDGDIGRQAPNVQIVDVGDAWDVLQVLQEADDVHARGGGVHEHPQRRLDDGESGEQHQDGEDEGSDGVSQVPCRLHPDDDRRDHDANALNQVPHHVDEGGRDGQAAATVTMRVPTVGVATSTTMGVSSMGVATVTTVGVATMGVALSATVGVAQRQEQRDVHDQAERRGNEHDQAIHLLWVEHALHSLKDKRRDHDGDERHAGHCTQHLHPCVAKGVRRRGRALRHVNGSQRNGKRNHISKHVGGVSEDGQGATQGSADAFAQHQQRAEDKADPQLALRRGISSGRKGFMQERASRFTPPEKRGVFKRHGRGVCAGCGRRNADSTALNAVLARVALYRARARGSLTGAHELLVLRWVLSWP